MLVDMIPGQEGKKPNMVVESDERKHMGHGDHQTPALTGFVEMENHIRGVQQRRLVVVLPPPIQTIQTIACMYSIAVNKQNQWSNTSESYLDSHVELLGFVCHSSKFLLLQSIGL